MSIDVSPGFPDVDCYRDHVQLSLGCYGPAAETHVQVRRKGHAIFLAFDRSLHWSCSSQRLTGVVMVSTRRLLYSPLTVQTPSSSNVADYIRQRLQTTDM